MAFTQTMIDALDRAISSGAKEVWYGNKKTVYHSLDEMMRLRDLMNAEVNGVPSLESRKKMAIFKSTTNRNC